MIQPVEIERAFDSLRLQPTSVQALLQPVLIRAMQDPPLLQGLRANTFERHFIVLAQLILDLRNDPFREQFPASGAFLHLTVGEDLEQPAEAYEYVRTLASPLRERVEGSLFHAIHRAALRSTGGPINLLSLARFLRIALSDLPFIAHVLSGGEVEDFLPTDKDLSPEAAWRVDQRIEPTSHQNAALSPQLARFLGAAVEVLTVVPTSSGSHVFLAIGTVLEISPTHLILQSLGSLGRAGEEPLLVSLANVIAVHKLSGAAA
jgi:hypothetical protein